MAEPSIEVNRMRESRDYEGLPLMYVGEDEDSGVYVRMHEIIAMLRCEALLARADQAEGYVGPTDELLDSIADGLAQQAVEMEADVERWGSS